MSKQSWILIFNINCATEVNSSKMNLLVMQN